MKVSNSLIGAAGSPQIAEAHPRWASQRTPERLVGGGACTTARLPRSSTGDRMLCSPPGATDAPEITTNLDS